jgi:transcriptional regulator with XRE-family HTH domain
MSVFAAPSENDAIGARLFQFRQSVGLTQTAMAEAIGVSARTYQNYERGEREISAIVIRALYRKFGVDPVWVLDGDDTPPRRYSAQMDANLLTIVLEEVESRLEASKKKLRPAKKAKLIMLIYQHFDGVREPDLAFVDSALALVA